MNQVVTKSKCDIVSERLIHEIVNGIYPLGSQLPTENELCENYGVSRITVRESLKKLSSMGIVSIQQGRGTFVSNINVGMFMNPLLPLIEFETFDIMTIYDARLFIETGTCRLAARNRTDEDIEILKRLVAQIDEYFILGDFQNGVEWDTRFHIAVAETSRNQILKASVINLEKLSQACARKLNKAYVYMDEANEHHRRIVQAIEQKDEDAAERAITEHTLKAEELFLSE